MSQHGQVSCVDIDADLTTCGTRNTAAYGHSALPALADTPRIINGEQHGSRIFFTHSVPSGVVFHCWDVATDSACASWSTPRYNTTLTGKEDQRLTHFRYDALTNDPIAICVTNLDLDNNACYDFSGNGPTSIAGLSTAVAILDNTWAGDTFTWEGKRTFFAGGNSNKTGCWNWETASSCGTIDHARRSTLAPAPTAATVGASCGSRSRCSPSSTRSRRRSPNRTEPSCSTASTCSPTADCST